MLGIGLYYPFIDIEDPAWLRSALLFWDEIQTIAPSAIERPYTNKDSIVCEKEGLLRPLRCDIHSPIIDGLGQKIVRVITDDSELRWNLMRRAKKSPALEFLSASEELLGEMEHEFRFVNMMPEKMSPEILRMAVQFGLVKMHRDKIPPGIEDLFEEMRHFNPRFMRQMRRHPEEGDWLLVDSRFAEAYMAALASDLAKQLDLSPLTAREPTHGLSFRFLFEDIIDETPRSANGALISVVMRGLRVDPSVPIQKLISFKKNRKDQYLEMTNHIDSLATELKSDSGEDVINKATKLYERKIEPSLRSLKRELEHQSIQCLWEGAYRAITISVPSAGALALLTGLSGPALLGAGAALAAADIGVRSYLAGRKTRGNNPFSYLYDAKANFGLPAFSD